MHMGFPFTKTTFTWPDLRSLAPLVGISLIAMTLAAPCVPAQTPDAPAPTNRETSVDALFDMLDADEAADRQEAMRQLMRNPELDREDFARMYQRANSEEQRQRLLKIARHHAIRRLARQAVAGDVDRGSVGVTHRAVATRELKSMLADVPNAQAYVGGIYIMDTLAGFPGYVELQADDVIVAIDGVPLPEQVSMMGFGEMIEQRDADSRIVFTILRNGRVEDVDLTLAPQSAMREIYAQSTSRPNDSIEGFWRIWKRGIVNPD